MGPALETFLGVALLIALIVGGGVWMTRPFWPRIANYFRRWHERDMRLEQQQREEAECREKARREVGELCHDAERRPQAASAQMAQSIPQTQPACHQTPNERWMSAPDTASERAGEQAAAQTQEPEAKQPAVQQIELHQ